MNAPKDQVAQVSPSESPSEQKQYEKPEIIYCAPLEAMAGSCSGGAPAKTGSGDGCTVANS